LFTTEARGHGGTQKIIHLCARLDRRESPLTCKAPNVQEGHGPARRQAGAFGAGVVQVHFIPHVLYPLLSLSKDYVPLCALRDSPTSSPPGDAVFPAPELAKQTPTSTKPY